jgi:multimeric flavodoxin WrbA
MKILLLSSSPNHDGLTAACTTAIAEGITASGGVADIALLNDLDVGMCRACDRGWGTCLEDHRCKTEDDFGALHERVAKADGYALITPVYWGEMSESAKAFTDRLRRCEATREREKSVLSAKPVLAIAAAGGGGGGMITCLASMERWIQHVQARTFDLIGVNRWSREYKLVAIREAARTMTLDKRA